MKFCLSTILQQLAVNGNCGTQQDLPVSIEVLKKIVPFQQARVRIPTLEMRCKKWFNWTSGVFIWLRLLTTPTLQPWCKQLSFLHFQITHSIYFGKSSHWTISGSYNETTKINTYWKLCY